MNYKYILTSIILISSLFLISCGSKTYPEPEGSLRSHVNGGAFGITIEMGDKIPRNPIEFKAEPLSKELKDYIIKNVPGYEKNRYLVQLESTTGVRLIDFKKSKTKIFYAPFDDTYNYIGGVLNSPDGKFIAMNLTKGFESSWSKLIIINVDENNFGSPLTDEILTQPSADSGCSEMTIVEVRSNENQHNACIVEAPQSTYMLDWWSTDSTIELIKRFPGSTIFYSLEVS
ncbi:MAG: hypothetical protein Q8P68_02300 [Candidatus Peregrinibacteria bacterium]|nr:hypothetical protein [Candidatus Peregrinibacteria bacterium]MDZ4245075.1 hypothetical protein [Candidatus Gracilibacteria bacterium]